MSARQKRPKTAVDQYLSILFLETANLRRQLYELNKLRYRVRQAELSARNRAQAHARARGRNPHQRPPWTRQGPSWVTPGRPALVIGRAPSEGLLRNGVVRALFALGDFPHPRARIAPTGR